MRCDACGHGRVPPLREKTRHRRAHVVALVRGIALHGLGIQPAHVHQADPGRRMGGGHLSAPGIRSARTSLRMSAPSASAARITSASLVSTDTGMPRPTHAAPRASRARVSRPCRGHGTRASSTRRRCPECRRPRPPAGRSARRLPAPAACAPPSENESGVTLTMPITRGRSRVIRKRPARCEEGAERPRAQPLSGGDDERESASEKGVAALLECSGR